MKALLASIVSSLIFSFRPSLALHAEFLALRHQRNVLHRLSFLRFLGGSSIGRRSCWIAWNPRNWLCWFSGGSPNIAPKSDTLRSYRNLYSAWTTRKRISPRAEL